MDKFERELLAKVAAVPVGEKLPLSRIARELDCSTSVAISGVAALVMAGKLDKATVRPPIASDPCDDAAILLVEIEAFLASTGMRPSTFGKRAVGSFSFVPNLRTAKTGPRPRTIAKVRAFMTGQLAPFDSISPAPIEAPVGEAALVPGAGEAGATVARYNPVAPAQRSNALRVRSEAAAAERLPGETLADAMKRQDVDHAIALTPRHPHARRFPGLPPEIWQRVRTLAAETGEQPAALLGPLIERGIDAMQAEAGQ